MSNLRWLLLSFSIFTLSHISYAESPTKPLSDEPLQTPRGSDGDGSVSLHGEMQLWHKITLDLAGPYAHELDNTPNPFTDYRFNVRFRHEDGTTYTVPGYFAADGNASNTSADSGNVWRAHFAPDRIGKWSYSVSFESGAHAALNKNAATIALATANGKSGSFEVAASDKSGRDLRSRGRLNYVGKRYLQFAGTGEYFIKAGADAPETLLGYADFDNTIAGNPKKVPLKTWAPHLQDWKNGDPVWQTDKGKGLIGAVNYLSGKGCNAFSFLTYNAGGDGDNVWPFVDRNDKLHYDCSKLDQWGVVFDHGTHRGMYLHFKMQESENDDHNAGKNKTNVPESLDGGDLGWQRKLYCRELISRFGHALALNWNLGEENTQTTQQIQAMVDYIAESDPYQHLIVLHTFPNEQDKQYLPLIGNKSKLTGLSLQNGGIHDTHWQTVKWVNTSADAGKPWVVAFDESGTAAHGQCPDLGYEGYDGKDNSGKMTYTQHDVRHQTLYGTLMGGGAGVEYYFGYQYAQNDLKCEDWRSREQSWDYCRVAIELFEKLPLSEMLPADELIGNPKHDNSRFCFAKPGELYLVYLPSGGSTQLDMSSAQGAFTVTSINPANGNAADATTVIQGGASVEIVAPNTKHDWLIRIEKST